MQSGYSTDLDARNIFVKNSNLLVKLQTALKERIHLLTFLKHGNNFRYP